MTGTSDLTACGNAPLVHPGPPSERRRSIVPTRTRFFPVEVDAGDNPEAAILRAFEHARCASGWVRMDGLRCDPLRYVVPAAAKSAERLAGYSDPVQPDGVCEIRFGYMSVGRDGTHGATHCHGIWHHADGTEALGHLLATESRVAAPATLRACGFLDARFDREPDPETRFDLFTVTGDGTSAPDAIAMTLRPNESLPEACRATCARFGIAAADVVGLGSLNGARFLDGRRMQAPINEFVIRRGRVDALGSDVFDLAVIDVEGTRFDGPVDPADATISITAEVVILPDATTRVTP